LAFLNIINFALVALLHGKVPLGSVELSGHCLLAALIVAPLIVVSLVSSSKRTCCSRLYHLTTFMACC